MTRHRFTMPLIGYADKRYKLVPSKLRIWQTALNPRWRGTRRPNVLWLYLNCEARCTPGSEVDTPTRTSMSRFRSTWRPGHEPAIKSFLKSSSFRIRVWFDQVAEMVESMPEQGKSTRWSELRFFMGHFQMFGATVSLALLLWMGIVRETIIAVSITFAVTTLSLLLWGRKSDNVPFRWMKRE